MYENVTLLNGTENIPLRDIVFQTLREAILRGKLQPGERLMEIALANQLGVSRTPVREAIRMLELEGLVVMIPRRGAAVAGISPRNLRNVLEVRKALEKLCVELACIRMTEEQFVRLKIASKAFERALGTDDVTAIAQTDEAFHDVIFESTDNEKLILLLNQLREQMYRYRVEHIKSKEMRANLLKEHQAIVAALEKRDQEEAKRLIGIHIDNQVDVVSEIIKGDKV